jgi:hypothetical protein
MNIKTKSKLKKIRKDIYHMADDTPYNTRLEHNNKFAKNIIDAINNNIKEYRGIKFCSDDIILY